MRYFIELSYRGTNYHGWQKQPNANTVQEELDKALTKIYQSHIEVVGAGRTDAGVHAHQMYAHFDLDFDNEFKDIKFRLNSILPNDILIINIFKVKDNVHCRFNAISRTYKYYIQSSKNVFNEDIYIFSKKLDIMAMNEASHYLLGNQDFTSFSKLHSQTYTNLCDITYAKWEYNGDILVFTISANRFLRNMVRAIVGTLIDVGLAKIKPIEIKDIISYKNRSKASSSAPAHALFLNKIEYPEQFKSI
tara:strand:- start:549 stop:1292 length:744 start_codon:yes stop_codon:yes gene_type:complete